MKKLPAAALLLLAGCTAPAMDPGPGGGPDAGAADQAGADAFAEVDRLARERAAAVGAFGLAVYGADDRLLFRRMYGDFAPDRRVAVASASKLASGLALLRLVSEGRLSLDSTTGQVLGWAGDKGQLTLRHLLSFTSGLPPEAACTRLPNLRLQDCAALIAQLDPVAPPGQRFDYGPTHLQVAGRMAEVVTGKGWGELFAEQLGAPLGLPAEVTYYTAPQQGLGRTNPLVAGGMTASMDEYARILALAFHRGEAGGRRLIRDDLFSAQAREPYAVTVGESPMQRVGYDFRYGLAAWLECDTPQAGCAVLSSPGAFGWTPWLDRQAGYYAIIGTLNADSKGQVVKESVDLAQALKPLIARALGR